MGHPEKLVKIEKPQISLKPSIIIFCGPPLTGKSTLAESLTRITNVSYKDIDAVRLEQHPLHDPDKILETNVELKHTDIATSALCHWALNTARRKKPVIITATFSRDKRKEMMKKLINEANQYGIPVAVFRLVMDDPPIAERRIKKRKIHGNLSNIKTQELWQWAQTLFTTFPADFPVPVHLINSARPVHKSIREILRILSKENFVPSSLQNLIVPLVTPFKLNDISAPMVDRESLTKLINHIITGIRKNDSVGGGIFILGTAGEFRELTIKQKTEVIKTASQAIVGRLPLLVGVSSDSLQETEQLSKIAKEYNASALVITPYHGDGDPWQKIELVAKTGMPFLIYNNPPIHTGEWKNQDISLDLIIKVMEKYPDNFIGIKDSSKNEGRSHQVMTVPNLPVFHGSITTAVKEWGIAKGGVFAPGNIYPGELSQAVQQLHIYPNDQSALQTISDLRQNLGNAQEIKNKLYAMGIISSAMILTPQIK